MPTTSASAPFLVFEAATSAGSLAIVGISATGGSEILTSRDIVMGVGRDDTLFPAVALVLADAKVHGRELAGIVCGSGPGSFTSLRIAASLAKGLATGYGCPLFAVSSLLLAAAAVSPHEVDWPHGRPMVLHADALRGERYVQSFERLAGGLVAPRSAVSRVPADALLAHADGVVLVGVRGAAPVADPAAFPDTRHWVTPHASGLVQVPSATWRTAVSLESWAPEYGRLAEAQVKWEVTHQRALPTGETPHQASPA